jgi:hypothetical protein
MTNTNLHGLSRHIPAAVALEIRRRSKFGCVHCRSAIYQYEHIDPEFHEATSHNPDDICLLCGGCHDRVTRGRISKKTIREDYERVQHAADIRRPFEELDLNTQTLTVRFGSCSFSQSNSLITVNGETLLSILPPRQGECAPRISGSFYDSSGNECFRIVENVWEGDVDSWDITVIGPRVCVKTAPGDIALEIELVPPDEIRILRLNMYKDRCHLAIHDNELLVGHLHANQNVYFGLSGFHSTGATEAIAIDSRPADMPTYRGLQMSGGVGMILEGTGISVGKGAGQMLIGGVKVWELRDDA